MKSVGMASFL